MASGQALAQDWARTQSSGIPRFQEIRSDRMESERVGFPWEGSRKRSSRCHVWREGTGGFEREELNPLFGDSRHRVRPLFDPRDRIGKGWQCGKPG